MPSEHSVEERLRLGMRRLGGWCVKLPPTAGQSGLPDRLCIFPEPNRRVLFVELKQESGQLRTQQRNVRRKLQGMGHPVYILYTRDAVDVFLHNEGSRI